MSDLLTHTARRSTHLLKEFGWIVFNHHPPYIPDLASSDFHLFLLLKKFLSDQHERFQNDREAEMSVTQWFQSQAADFYHTGHKSWSRSMTIVSIPDMNMLKNKLNTCCICSNKFFIKLGFVSVSGSKETYFMHTLSRWGDDVSKMLWNMFEIIEITSEKSVKIKWFPYITICILSF